MASSMNQSWLCALSSLEKLATAQRYKPPDERHWQFSPSDITTFSWRDSVWELAPETLTQMCRRQVLRLRGVILLVTISHDFFNLYQWHINLKSRDLWKYSEITICDLKMLQDLFEPCESEDWAVTLGTKPLKPSPGGSVTGHLQDQYNPLHDRFCWSDQYWSRWHSKLTYQQFSS